MINRCEAYFGSKKLPFFKRVSNDIAIFKGKRQIWPAKKQEKKLVACFIARRCTELDLNQGYLLDCLIVVMDERILFQRERNIVKLHID